MAVERARNPLGVAAVAATAGAAGAAAYVGGGDAGLSALAGAATGALLQLVAAVVLQRRRFAANAEFLGAFALAALLRIGGGAASVLVLLAFDALAPLPTLFGWAVGYAVLEVVTDVMFVRGERRSATRC